MNKSLHVATLAGGCFWCLESAFNQVQGIHSVKSGYSGGQTENPTYKDVCTGNTGHAEVIRVEFDLEAISYREILEIFFALHDPTQVNRQGNDIGSQYRTAIFYHDEAQAEAARSIIAEMEQEQTWEGPIVTQIEPIATFYPAEDYHDNYFERNPENQYCQAVVSPKLAKFKKTFASRLK
ncbi:peptide-methionine (S)-S-oxide reductase MsrA [Aliidiomarina halalkaliphila]|uniref:Peptide methionine sulfoxide reductase MsrA n=1 Tax=Aliidiomarina halalkaliphila TaxID=2593535 RepID=A0A552X5M8_9GAMM|nr:peptide-methionine (S)-S-oxide reductase MsrA [Aliidiomarina halalkaliphila]TRW50328.1 peptide-methionine (S)-S-oxide reductase MsrA [Aliidiomarina halalkaliphila]